ncbi:helix-turn-helix transcriptional regulator [Actinokineospora diospyrosa]|nr:helix-turn-helix transcriptional regulator [Actinokineospora diospyrosa]
MTVRRSELARRRKAQGLSQEQLAEALHVDRITVYRWEAGRNEPQPYLWPKLAALLGISRSELVQLLSPQPGAFPTPPAATPLSGAQDTEHLAKALTDSARFFDGPIIGYFELQLRTYMSYDGTEGPRTALPGVLGLLRAVKDNAREVPHRVRGDLLRFGAKSAEFAGWLYRDLQETAAARFWHDRATEWAQEAGDLPFQGYVLLKR